MLCLSFKAALPEWRTAVLPLWPCIYRRVWQRPLSREHRTYYESAVHLHSWPTNKGTSPCGTFAFIFIILNLFSYSDFTSLAVFLIPLPSHLGILMSSKPTAARARTTPRLGGPQGLNSWARPERRGARIRPTAVTDCPAPIRVPLAWTPPLCSSRSVMHVRPIEVEMAKKLEVNNTCHTLGAAAYRKINEQVRTVEWSSRAAMLFPYSWVTGPTRNPARAPSVLP